MSKDTSDIHKEFLYEFNSKDGKYVEMVFLLEQSIIFTESKGFVSLETAKEIFGKRLEYYNETNSLGILLLVDMSQFGSMDTAARKYSVEVFLSKNSIFKKIGVCKADFISRTILNMYSSISGIPLKFFETQKKAIEWLRD